MYDPNAYKQYSRTDIPAPIELPPTTVKPEWIDYNGHMNVAYYLLAFDLASDVLTDYLGLNDDYKTRSNTTTFAGQANIVYKQEVREGDPLKFLGRIVAADQKRVHYFTEMYHAEEGFLAATHESITLHIDLSVRRVAPMADEVWDFVRQVRDKHAELPPPPDLGRMIKVKNG